ncbi:hypothetical protein CF319_g2839 [Tilletia indica]|nr:hypothetical protein CF319_g2839 [Tilletia indica]
MAEERVSSLLPYESLNPGSSSEKPKIRNSTPYAVRRLESINDFFATLNCGKAGLRRRLTDIFGGTNPALCNVDILFLQECGCTHPTPIDDPSSLAAVLGPFFRPQFRGILSQDAGILLLTTAATPLAAHTGPRWAHIQARLRPLGPGSAAVTAVDLWSIHGPVRDFSFWEGQWTTARRSHSLSPDAIIGADWNAVPDPPRDSLFATTGSCPWQTIAPTIAPLYTVDAYRHLLPEGRAYTRVVTDVRGKITSAKRLDSIRLSTRLLQYARDPLVAPTSSDHYAAAISIKVAHAYVPPPPRHPHPWSLHPGTLRCPDFRSEVLAAAHQLGPPPPDAGPAGKVTQWRDYIVRLRDVTRHASLRVGKSLKKIRTDVHQLESDIGTLDLSITTDATRLPGLLDRLHTGRNLLADSAAIKCIRPRSADTFRPTSWMTPSLHRTGASHSVRRLRDQQGILRSDDEHMLRIVHAFYSELYTPPHPPTTFQEDRTLLLSTSLTRFSPEDVALLARPYTLDDVHCAVRSANEYSSPGPMGLPYPLISLTFEVTAPHLLNLIDGLGAGCPLPIQLQTTIIHKKGDKADLGNYRPISVSDTALRIVTRMLAHRLQIATGHALPWTQSAFMPGRRTSTVAGALQGIIDHIGANRPGLPTSIFILLLDQQKAYDRVGRLWLWSVLEHCLAPGVFTSIIQSLYHSPELQVVLNGALTDVIPLQTGLLQGDPLSCALYNLALQPLLDLLTQLEVGIIVPGLGLVSSLAFADDVAILLPGTPEGISHWTRTHSALRAYESASGARLNWDKSGFIEVVSPAHNPHDSASLRAGLISAGLRPVPTPNMELTHLGHPLHVSGPGSPCPISYNERIEAMGTRIRQIQTTNTDIITRTRLCNSLLTPKIWHQTSVGGLPPNARRSISLALCPFLYLGDKPWFDTDTLSAPLHLGGLGIIHPDHMFTAQAITFLAHNLLRDDGYGLWLRDGIAWTLYHVYQSSPATLLIPAGRYPSALAHISVREAGFWGRLIHALASVHITLASEWTELDGTAILELPWYQEPLAMALAKPWPLKQYRSATKHGWTTWGDVLWKSTLATRDRLHAPSWPLGPPSPKAVAANAIPLPGRATHPSSPALGTMWNPYWRSLPVDLRRRLLSTADSNFATGPDDSLPLPRTRDPYARSFPWHLILVHGRPLSSSTTRKIRLSQGRQTPIITSWPTELQDSPPATWGAAWTELHACPLSSLPLSDTFLWMHRKSWLALSGPDRLPCSFLDCDDKDGQEHSFVSCSQIRTLWLSALPILRALGVTAPISLEPHLVALAWPAIRRHRPRLVLWRTAIIHTITHLRRPALHRLIHTNSFHLRLPPDSEFAASVGRLVAEGITNARAQDRARNSSERPSISTTFINTWITDSSFAFIDGTQPLGIGFHLPSRPFPPV